MVEFVKDCDVAQGYAFKADQRRTFGFITKLVVWAPATSRGT